VLMAFHFTAHFEVTKVTVSCLYLGKNKGETITRSIAFKLMCNICGEPASYIM
jgi:hypothetical protein